MSLVSGITKKEFGKYLVLKEIYRDGISYVPKDPAYETYYFDTIEEVETFLKDDQGFWSLGKNVNYDNYRVIELGKELFIKLNTTEEEVVTKNIVKKVSFGGVE